MKALLTILFICSISFTALGQFNKKNQGSSSASALPLKDRIYFGGGGSVSAGTYPTTGIRYTYFAINPLIGYRLTLPWSVGVQVLYQTYRFQQSNLNINQYGIAPFTQYRFGQLFVYGEYQMINALNINGDSRSVYSRLPVGVGFSQPIGKRAAVNVVLLYDLLYATRDVYSPFISPWVFRIYITAGGISF